MNKKMNFVLFYPETVRADAIINKGIRRAKTPNFDQLAKEGVSFSNCFTQSPFCTPSRCSMFTGRYPHSHGHRNLMHLLHEHERNLFQDLKEAGYETVCWGKNDLVAGNAIKNSFDCVETYVKAERPTQKSCPDPDFAPGGKYYGSFYYGSRGNEPCHDFDWSCVESALQFIERENHDKPFCIFLPLTFAHPVYAVEEPFFSMHDRDEMPEPFKCDLKDRRSGFEYIYRARGLEQLSNAHLKEIRATYYGMISRLDHQFGMISDKLKECGLYEETALFMFSDHGDYTGDYGQVEKWNLSFEDCLLNVPLIARIPGFKPAGRKNCLVEMIDIYPTILELANVKPRHHHFGRSLLKLMQETGDAGYRKAVFAETGWNIDEEHCMTPAKIAKGPYALGKELRAEYPAAYTRSAMIRTEKYKYVFSPDDRNELFDLEKDPRCLNNLAGNSSMRNIENELKLEMLEWYLKTSDSTPLEPDYRGWEEPPAPKN